ncbi:co-chaperone GroES [Candidatus Vampirococcus lugosii]|uniref:Co-chaperonin GroES n=1 Tax=Candidatus Vampirococcus lugosii TaxID=2789015 RepID=A0ABS5QM80_9BACT|nr:co-chaperone GroES [Candidatus Vampirococcus lugosii]MBS8122172.1 molecular chaperone GroES [Candidatus Vampirococcus lugosii]
MSKLYPIEDNVVVKACKEETKTKSGIVLPESNKEKPGKGEVVAVGEGKILDDGSRSKMDVNVGDIVYFTKYSPDEIEVESEGEKVKYLVLKHSSILAKDKK